MTSATSQDPRLGTDQHYRWLHAIVKVLLALNLLDATFTLAWVNAGLAREANPLLADLVRNHPVLFSAVKLGLVGMGSLLLWRQRHNAAAVIGIFVVFLVYYVVFLYHLGYLSLILGTILFP